MSLNPLNEVKYRYRLAIDCLSRAERAFSNKDWVVTVSSSQLAIGNFAKAIIAIFEIPTWSHDPSRQLEKLLNKMPSKVMDDIMLLAKLAKEIAPEHGRSTYGEPDKGLIPSDIYKEGHAIDALNKAKKAKEIVEMVLKEFKIRID